MAEKHYKNGGVMGTGNPAGRLLNILEEARGIDDGITIQEAWRRILGVQKGDHALLMYRFGKVLQLPQETINMMWEHEPDRVRRQKHWLESVQKAFLIGMNGGNGTGKWNAVKSQISEQTIGFVDMTSGLLERAGHASGIPDEHIDSLRKKLEGVREDLEEASLSAKAKALIRRHINNALCALDEYKISGKQGVEEATHLAVGELAVSPEVRRELSMAAVGRSFAGVILFMLAIIGGLNDSAQLANAVPKFLEDMRGDEEPEAEFEEVIAASEEEIDQEDVK